MVFKFLCTSEISESNFHSLCHVWVNCCTHLELIMWSQEFIKALFLGPGHFDMQSKDP